MGAYFCGTCKFFDNDLSKGIWHCEKCGLCRAGHKDKYEHCDTCGMCLPPGEHIHGERVFEADCPVCAEYLLTSTKKSFTPKPCGHPIHTKCWKQLITGRYSCPICLKTYSDFNMEPVWVEMRQLMQNSPMPPEYAGWKVEVLCNDCEKRTVSDFHWLGTECSNCHCWNTKVTKNIRPNQ